MVLQLLLVVTVLHLALSTPDNPRPIRSAIGSRGCLFGDRTYLNGANLTETCLELQCIEGSWKYTGRLQYWNCGQCQVFGEPHIHPYNPHQTKTGPQFKYEYQGSGTYVISQPGLLTDPLVEFGVNSNFEKCIWNGQDGLTCVKSFTYYEPGFNIDVILSPNDNSTGYWYCLDHPNDPNDPLCTIKVLVNGKDHTIDSSVSSFNSTDGTVLAFKHAYTSAGDSDCINIVGSKGFSVIVCRTHASNYVFVYVWAMKSLANKIFGLCGRYNDHQGFQGWDNYEMGNGSTTMDADKFAATWKIRDSSSTSSDNPIINRCTNATVLSQIEGLCQSFITRDVCTTVSGPHCPAFNEACVFDLCRVPDPLSYAEGYYSHMRIHTHFYQSS